MYAIETKNLSKHFGSFKAVDNLDLKVPEGSVYGFLGPNGAGKTTTIKMLTGLSRPTSGEIKVYDREVHFGSLKNRIDIGFLPDVPSYYDWMNAREFLTFCGELFGIDKKVLRNRIENLLDLVGLTGVKKKVGGYSRGMKQRLGIAQALVHEPKVVFLDEPTSALDPIGRKEVMDIITKLSGKVTVFFSTHILSDIERVCDSVIILKDGQMQIEDTIANLKQNYSHRTVSLEISDHDRKVELLETLKKQDWVKRADNADNGEILIGIRDMQRGQIEIPRLLNDKGMGLKKFIIQEPSLEDIFLKVVNKQ